MSSPSLTTPVLPRTAGGRVVHCRAAPHRADVSAARQVGNFNRPIWGNYGRRLQLPPFLVQVGGGLGRLAVNTGEVALSSSGIPTSLRTSPPDSAALLKEAAHFGGLCVLAVPLAATNSLLAAALVGKVVIDAMNHYPERDGPAAALDKRPPTTNELVARSLPGPQAGRGVQRHSNRDPQRGARPLIHCGRRALAIAGEDDAAIAQKAELHDAFGFTHVRQRVDLRCRLRWPLSKRPGWKAVVERPRYRICPARAAAMTMLLLRPERWGSSSTAGVRAAVMRDGRRYGAGRRRARHADRRRSAWP